MLLLLSTSGDGTAALIAQRFLPNVFRLNYDIWHDYRLLLRPDYWEIEDPSGRKITSKSVTRSLWWKVFDVDLPQVDPMISADIRYAVREIYADTVRRGLRRGNPPEWHRYFGKIAILEIASKQFRIPKTSVSWHGAGLDNFSSDEVVAKSLDSVLTSDGKGLFTTKVNPGQLDTTFPWFLQDFIESDWDVTVLLVGRSLFAFKRSRLNLVGIDWRLEQSFRTDSEEWLPTVLPKQVEDGLRKISQDLNVEFGRFDLMLEKKSGEFIFLEFNANGQWGFLDFNGRFGLLDSIVEYISA